MQIDPFRKRLTTFSVGLPPTVCSFVSDFIALEVMQSELVAFHDDNFCNFHVPCAHALVKERKKETKKETKRERERERKRERKKERKKAET